MTENSTTDNIAEDAGEGSTHPREVVNPDRGNADRPSGEGPLPPVESSAAVQSGIQNGIESFVKKLTEFCSSYAASLSAQGPNPVQTPLMNSFWPSPYFNPYVMGMGNMGMSMPRYKHHYSSSDEPRRKSQKKKRHHKDSSDSSSDGPCKQVRKGAQPEAASILSLDQSRAATVSSGDQPGTSGLSHLRIVDSSDEDILQSVIRRSITDQGGLAASGTHGSQTATSSIGTHGSQTATTSRPPVGKTSSGNDLTDGDIQEAISFDSDPEFAEFSAMRDAAAQTKRPRGRPPLRGGTAAARGQGAKSRGSKTTSSVRLSNRKLECQVCYDKEPNHALVECGHLMCEACLRRTRLLSNRCPVCRNHPMGQDIKLFF